MWKSKAEELFCADWRRVDVQTLSTCMSSLKTKLRIPIVQERELDGIGLDCSLARNLARRS